MEFDLSTIELLEFDRIYDKFFLCKKFPIKTELSKLKFHTDKDKLKNTQKKVYTFKQLIEEFGYLQAKVRTIPNFDMFQLPGFCASGEEIYEIADFLLQCFEYLEYINKASLIECAEDAFISKSTVFTNKNLKLIAQNILKDFDSNGEINPNHPALKEIARKKQKIRSSISQVSSKYFSSNPEIWQETIPVFKNGRTMLPIKSGEKNKIQGIVTNYSATRLTSYIEPFELVELNNAFLEIENEIKKIVLDLLKKYTENISHEINYILDVYDYLTKIDYYYALAEYSKKNNYFTAEISEKTFYLKNAKHPLLEVKPIPVTIKVEEDKIMTIISGPNTGGKTVALKTVGLFCLMMQFGMDIPADEGSTLPIYNNVYADIGDMQSIALGLSTYSAHIATISRILQSASSRSLVLLDELGTGTDPIEGGAIAVSIAKFLLKKNISSFITSHIKPVKEIALEDNRVLNASMEFDTKSNSPTYRLIFGRSASSYAIETAEKYGLAKEIIKDAKAIMASQITDLDIIRKNLLEKEEELFTLEESIKQRHKQLQNQIRNNDLKELQLKQKEYEYRQKSRADESFFVKDARKKLNKVIDEIKSTKDINEINKKANKFIQDLNAENKKQYDKLEKKEIELAELNTQEFHEGMHVKVGRFKVEGVLVKKEKKKRWLVQAGSIKLTVSEKDLIADNSHKYKNNKQTSYTVEKAQSSSSKYIIDCRGMIVDEALKLVDRTIDQNLLAGLENFSIIHGVGYGVLGPAIQQYLETLDYVEEYNYARPEDGGTGKTYVKLRV